MPPVSRKSKSGNAHTFTVDLQPVLNIVIAAALFAVFFTVPAQGFDTRYFWCSLRSSHSRSTTAYFSEVFEGDTSNSGFFMNAFNAYVHANYSDVTGAVTCTWARDPPAATAQRDNSKARAKETSQRAQLFKPTGHTQRLHYGRPDVQPCPRSGQQDSPTLEETMKFIQEKLFPSESMLQFTKVQTGDDAFSICIL